VKKHILLVAPYIHDFAAYDLWLKPLGLLYIAAAAEAAGYSVRLVNCLDRLHPDALALDHRLTPKSAAHGKGKFSFEEIPKPLPLAKIPRAFKRYGIPTESFRNELRAGPRPDAIGLGSMMTYWYPGVAETIKQVREIYPDVPIILGGIYATLCPNHAREHSGADYVVGGTGERQFVELLGQILGPGEEQPPRLFIRPAYHLLPNLDSVSMLTSRGCPFCCAYCASRLLSAGFTQPPPGEVVEEIVYYTEIMKITDIAFYDDALLVNPENHIKPILREVIGRKLHVRLHTPNGLHANMIDDELAGLMKRSGFATIRLSLESVYPALLQESFLKVSAAGFENAVEALFRAGYQRGSVEAYVLMGMPGQQPQEVEDTMRFAHQKGVLIRLADFSPIPGTGYFQKACEVFGIDMEEPLLQNSSVLPYLAPHMLDSYRRLKSLARLLNAEFLSRHAETSLDD
jgi:radical SAM superfamily enzyme YgiQ (UPF0313 family)